jgi:hypothetical protein
MKSALALSALFFVPLIAVRPMNASIDEGLLALVPESTVVLTSVDADATRASEFGQFLLRRMDSDDTHLQDFIAQTGFDPRRDLQNMLFATFKDHGSNGDSRFAILARGTFDAARIAAAAKAKNAFAPQQYAGTELFVNREPGKNNAFAFPDTGVLVFGDVATVKGILDRRAKPTALDPGLLQRVNQVGEQNDLWFASLLSGSFLGQHVQLPGNVPKLSDSSAVQSIQQSTGGLRFGDQVKVRFDATTRSADDATSLCDLIRFLSSMIQTQRRNDANAAILASAFDTMQLQANGTQFHFGVSISEKNLELLAESGAKRAQ